jgi:hypothetical protein
MPKVKFTGYIKIPIEGMVEADTVAKAEQEIMDLEKDPNEGWDYKLDWVEECEIIDIWEDK